MRAVVTVGTGNRPYVGKNEGNLIGTPFEPKVDRLVKNFEIMSPGAAAVAYRELPPGCPPHLEVPYAFKPYALTQAGQKGYDTLLWADSSIMPVRPVEPLWQQIERDGYWIADNHGWSCGQWTCDAALPLLGITREESFEIPHLAATSFGLSLSHPIAVTFLSEYMRMANNGAFKGPWVNSDREASFDSRVLGHRHDQTALSVIAFRLGMRPTPQPKFFTDCGNPNQETCLVVWR